MGVLKGYLRVYHISTRENWPEAAMKSVREGWNSRPI
jgi:hypothetical protein